MRHDEEFVAEHVKQVAIHFDIHLLLEDRMYGEAQDKQTELFVHFMQLLIHAEQITEVVVFEGNRKYPSLHVKHAPKLSGLHFKQPVAHSTQYREEFFEFV